MTKIQIGWMALLVMGLCSWYRVTHAALNPCNKLIPGLSMACGGGASCGRAAVAGQSAGGGPIDQ